MRVFCIDIKKTRSLEQGNLGEKKANISIIDKNNLQNK